MGLNPLPLNLITWAFLLASMLIFTYIIRDISRRLGEALHMRRYYLFYDSGTLVLIFAVLLGIFSYAVDVPVYFYGFNVPFAGAWLLSMFAIAVDFLVTVKYWGWLLPELLNFPKK